MDGGDAVLVARVAAGDDDAIAEVFDRYGSLLFGIARRVTLDATLAEDVVQEVLAALWAHPERFDADRGTLRSFLGVQAYRRAVDVLRRDGRRRVRESECMLDPAWSARPADEIDASTVAEVVRQAIARLPDDQRRAVELAFWEGHTHVEVAACLGIPEGTAKSRLRLAQRKLTEWLAPLAAEPA